jgi:hypothetical protein
MSAVLTKDSTLQCTHQGTVTLIPSQSKLTINGQAALVDGDLSSAPISGCQTPVSQTSTKCLTVSTTAGGVAAKLTVGGKGVLLQDVNGQTSGVIGGTPQTWSVTDAGQTKLKAV